MGYKSRLRNLISKSISSNVKQSGTKSKSEIIQYILNISTYNDNFLYICACRTKKIKIDLDYNRISSLITNRTIREIEPDNYRDIIEKSKYSEKKYDLFVLKDNEKRLFFWISFYTFKDYKFLVTTDLTQEDVITIINKYYKRKTRSCFIYGNKNSTIENNHNNISFPYEQKNIDILNNVEPVLYRSYCFIQKKDEYDCNLININRLDRFIQLT